MELEDLYKVFDGRKPIEVLEEMEDYLKRKYNETLYGFFVVTNYESWMLKRDVLKGLSAKQIVDRNMEF